MTGVHQIHHLLTREFAVHNTSYHTWDDLLLLTRISVSFSAIFGLRTGSKLKWSGQKAVNSLELSSLPRTFNQSTVKIVKQSQHRVVIPDSLRYCIEQFQSSTDYSHVLRIILFRRPRLPRLAAAVV